MRPLPTALLLLALTTASCASAEDQLVAPSPTPSRMTAPTTPTPSATPSPTPSPAPSPVPAATEPATSAQRLAADLVAAEQAIRDEQTPDDHIRQWAHLQQARYRQLAVEPSWDDVVREAVPDELVEVVERNVRATRELRALTSPREELPDWTIVEPPPADELLGHYRSAADAFGIDWTYLAAIHLVESRMGRIRGDSVAGAQGPMQFLPSTWEAYGEGDIHDYGDAIRAAARYLADHGAPDDMYSAVYAYNHSDHYVQAIEDHAAVIRDDVQAFHGYYHWQVYYRLVDGDVVLDEGWTSR